MPVKTSVKTENTVTPSKRSPSSGGIAQRLVLGNGRIYLLRPGGDAARQILHMREALLLQEFRSPLAAAARLALHDDVLLAVQFADPLWQIVQRNQVPTDIRDLVFVRLAHIQHEHILARGLPALQLLRPDLWNT